MRTLFAMASMAIISTVAANDGLAQGTSRQGLMGQFAVTPFVGASLPIQYLQSTEGGGRAEFGFAFGASGEYFIDDEFSAGGRFVFDRFGMDTPDPDDNGNWQIMEIGAFGRFSFTPGMPTRPFVRAGAMVAKAKATVKNGIEVESDISLAPGFEIGGGIRHEVAENIAVVGELGWTVIMTDGKDADFVINGTTISTSEMEKHLQWVGVKLGAMFFFGGP